MTTINPAFGRLLAGSGGALLIGSLFMSWSDAAGVTHDGWQTLWNWYLPKWLEWLPQIGDQHGAAPAESEGAAIPVTDSTRPAETMTPREGAGRGTP